MESATRNNMAQYRLHNPGGAGSRVPKISYEGSEPNFPYMGPVPPCRCPPLPRRPAGNARLSSRPEEVPVEEAEEVAGAARPVEEAAEPLNRSIAATQANGSIATAARAK